MRALWRAAAIVSCLTLAPAAAQRPAAPFAAQIASLSEPPGYFDTDNLISNERSYLQVLGELKQRNVRGGAYIGVGPDQNFSYIADVRPSIAFIVDVRRDNMLLHLLFKALFAQSRTRVEYLAQLVGRTVPADIEPWRDASIDRLVAYIDGAATKSGTPAAAAKAQESENALRRRLDEAIARMGVPLSAADRETLDRFHRRFMADGLSLRFESTGRPPQSYNPTFRDLLRETDSTGRQANYLASEDSFQFVKSLQARDLIVPVTGDLSGPSAVAAVGKAIAARGERVTVFYVSNVEFYLFGAGTFTRFVNNLALLPHAPNGVLIRSVFGRFAATARAADASASHVQSVAELLREHAAGRIRTYADIASR
jgi:hypothetical protein